MNRYSIVVIGLFTVLLGLPPVAAPCGCVTDGRPVDGAELLRGTGLVFRGKVLAIEPDPLEVIGNDPVTGEEILAGSRPNALTNYNVVTMRVERVWKGPVPRVVKVRTGSHGGNCGFSFIEKRRFVVFAASRDGELSTSSCSRTSAVEDARSLIAALDQSVGK